MTQKLILNLLALSSIILSAGHTLTVQAEVTNEMITLSGLTVSQDSPYYNSRYTYRLILSGKEIFDVKLQRFKLIQTDAPELPLDKEVQILKNAKIDIEKLFVTNEDQGFYRFDRLTAQSAQGKVEVTRIDSFTEQTEIQSDALRELFPDLANTRITFKKVRDYTAGHITIEYQGEFAPEVLNAKEIGSDYYCYGVYCTNTSETKFTLRGNQVRKLRTCENKEYDKNGNAFNNTISIDRKKLSRQGQIEVVVRGHLKSSCIRLLDENDNLLLETVIK